MGAEVTVLSQIADARRTTALALRRRRTTTPRATRTRSSSSANTFDLIINTVSAPLDMGAYLRLLRLDGTLVNVGAPAEPLPVHVFALFGDRRSLRRLGDRRHPPRPRRCSTSAPSTASPPEIELIAADQINEAYERVLASDVRYRFVIDTASLV